MRPEGTAGPSKHQVNEEDRAKNIVLGGYLTWNWCEVVPYTGLRF